MRGWRLSPVLILALALLLAGCDRAPTPGTAGLRICVSILPQKYFVERVGGAYVTVDVMVEPGANPETYEPKPEQLAALSEADAYMSIGVPFESAWLDRFAAANPGMRIVDTAAGIERMPMRAHSHDEGEASEDREGENPDPHIWLSPALVKVQAETICEALAALDPAHAEAYRANLERFEADIDELDAGIRQALGGVESRKFMVFHPAWGYLAREYGLEMISIEVGGQEPSASELAALIEEARREDIHIVFAQPEFSTRSAEVIADEIGGQVLLISPLAEDWLANLQRVADALAEALG